VIARVYEERARLFHDFREDFHKLQERLPDVKADRAQMRNALFDLKSRLETAPGFARTHSSESMLIWGLLRCEDRSPHVESPGPGRESREYPVFGRRRVQRRVPQREQQRQRTRRRLESFALPIVGIFVQEEREEVA
jgi:hypothetical protein